eukprot:jgi/Chrpa1/18751/Chrysochromulina_OHIO_Genome00018171-RA
MRRYASLMVSVWLARSSACTCFSMLSTPRTRPTITSAGMRWGCSKSRCSIIRRTQLFATHAWSKSGLAPSAGGGKAAYSATAALGRWRWRRRADRSTGSASASSWPASG